MNQQDEVRQEEIRKINNVIRDIEMEIANLKADLSDQENKEERVEADIRENKKEIDRLKVTRSELDEKENKIDKDAEEINSEIDQKKKELERALARRRSLEE